MTKFLPIIKKWLAYLEENKKIGDTILAVLLALCPLLQHYKGPVYNMAITVLVIGVPYISLRMLSRWEQIKPSRFLIVLVPVIYQLYRIVNHGTSVVEFGQSAVFIAFLLALALDCIDLRTLVRTAQLVCLVASVALIAQYVCHYVFDFHLQLVVTDWLLPSAEQWILGAQTGLAGITGKISSFYRPSAFFLEPSHVYIYMFPHLFILLFQNGSAWKTILPACLITVGLILTTSGMAVMVVAAAWVAFFLLYNNKEHSFSAKNIFRLRNLIVVCLLLVVFWLLMENVPTIQRTVSRIFSGKKAGTAIDGRVTEALKRLKRFDVMQWIFGIADVNADFRFYLPGAYDAIYRHGLIGAVLSMEFYCKSIFKLKLSHFLVAIVVVATSFFSAHTHSTIGMLYFTFILMHGFRIADEDTNLRLTGYVMELLKCLRDFGSRLLSVVGGKKDR